MMKRIQHKRLFLAAVLAVSAIVLSGCGEEERGAYLGAPGAPVDFEFSDSPSATPIGTNRTKLGVVVSGQAIRTLYTFQTDDGKVIDCHGLCVSTWLPVIVGIAGVDVSGRIDKSKVGAVKFSDKANQLTYNGHPLYFYAEDREPNSVEGAGLNSYGADWYTVDADGNLKK